MAGIDICCQILAVRRGLREQEIVKINIRREKIGLAPRQTWFESFKEGFRKTFYNTCFGGLFPCLVKQDEKTKSVYLTAGTYENTVFKACVGFGVGVVLSYIWYWVMVYQLMYSSYISMIVCSALATILCLGLPFSSQVRCITLLLLPSLCTKQGRVALLTYALVLIICHPVQNFSHNIQVMADSQTCGQEMAQNITKDVIDSAMAPVHGILNDIRETIHALMVLIDQLRKAFEKVRDIFQEVFDAISRAFEWLGEMVDVCNERMGAPYRKCCKVFDEAKQDCRDKVWDFLCEPVEWAKVVCQVARVGELLCFIVQSITNFVKSNIQPQIRMAVDNVYEMFYFNVTLMYHYNMTTHQSRSYGEVAQKIRGEVMERLEPLTTFMKVSSIVMIIMSFYLLVKAWLYRRKYLTNDRFDNCYITQDMRAMDEKREERDQETVLPLNWKESSKYIKMTSIRLTASEKKKMAFGFVMFIGTFLHGTIYMVCDYCLYWLLDMLRTQGQVDYDAEVPTHLKMHVVGEGILSDIYRTLITRFDPLSRLNMDFDAVRCLPNPRPPNYHIYKVVAIIYGVSLLMVIFEAYLLRLRHVITSHFHPEREKERSAWLYSHILMKRGGFLKHMRRQMRHDQQTTQKEQKFSIVATLASNSAILDKLFRAMGYRRKYCLCCALEGKMEDKENFVHCDNIGCDAVYCKDCFTDINNLCTVCMNPVDYGDMSDFSEERDSSADEDDIEIEERQKEEKKQSIEDMFHNYMKLKKQQKH